MKYVKYQEKRVNLDQACEYRPVDSPQGYFIKFHFEKINDKDKYTVQWRFDSKEERDKALKKVDEIGGATREITESFTPKVSNVNY